MSPDHSPAVVDANFLGQSDLLSTVEGQIALIGEALSHLDPVGLLPEDFLPTARSVIAKVRYESLRDNIDARLVAYACGNPGSRPSCAPPAPWPHW